MSEMVERVAKTIDPDAWCKPRRGRTESEKQAYREIARDYARAVLAELRDMEATHGAGIWPVRFRKMWREVFDAALA